MAKTSCSVIFTGDIGFDKYMDGKWEDAHLLSEEMIDYFHSADHVVANVEGALIDSEDNGSHGVFFHCMNPKAASVLEKMHADIWSFGNNHTMDAGAEGIISTKKIASDMGNLVFGAGMNEAEASEPIYLEEAGGIGIFGVSYMNECIPATENAPGIFRWDNTEYIKKRINEIKSKCRWCIVVSHGGEEFAPLPNPYTRDRYLKFLEFGADIVVAHHPHVPENFETFDNGKAIFYSLGNFIFDTDYQRAHDYTDIGVLLKITFTEESFSFEGQGTRIDRRNEHIKLCELPDVFTDIKADEYVLLSPLAAKAFVKEEMRKMVYLEPKKYSHASEETWDSYFFSTEPDGYFENEHMDLSVVVPFSKLAENGDWKSSNLEKVKDYILKLI